MMLALDHLVLAAPSLEAGVAHVERTLGVAVGAGGKHVGVATHNRLLRLDDIYLEILAQDPDAVPGRPRMFGLDDARFAPDASTLPALHTFVVRTDDIDAALAAMRGNPARAVEARRGDLVWRIGLPADGSMLFDGAFPTFIQWPDGRGPVPTMQDSGCSLVTLEISHPRAAEIEKALRPHMNDNRVRFSEGPFGLNATVATPGGLRRL